MRDHSRFIRSIGMVVMVGTLLPLSALRAADTAPESTPEPTPKPAAESAVPASADKNFDTVANSVVKIFSTARYPDVFKPWTKSAPSSATGSGVVIEGKRILSNAHVVEYASQIQIQANQSGDKINATVEAIAPGIDLAVLKLEDETFFDTHPPLSRAKLLPEIKDTAMVYGYPEGGTSLSITKGIVSRIEFAPYNFPVSGLRIQIDAAINPGNSGGPAVVGDKMIGLAFSRLTEADNIGYIIPSEEIDIFLSDIADGHYDGKPAVFDEFQTLENAALRAFLKLDKTVQGVIVHAPESSDSDYPLKEWDVITRIGDTPLDDQGMIKIGPNLRVYFTYYVQKFAKNGKLPLTIVRNGKEKQIDLPVTSDRPLVISDLKGDYPSYFIYGPLVFSKATVQFTRNFLNGTRAGRYTAWLSGMHSPLLSRSTDKPAFKGEEMVIVPSPFFPNKLVTGYAQPYYQVVKSINNIQVKNLEHVVQILRDSKDEFIRIGFDNRYGETVVFPRADTLAATDEILTDNGIRTQGSPDTMAVWNAKAN
jgi:S1-C subfamily serine protease